MPRPCGHSDDKLPTSGQPFRVKEDGTFDDCRTCWLYVHDANFRTWCDKEYIPPAQPNSVPIVNHSVLHRLKNPCAHLGAFTGEYRDCATCGGGKNIPIMACAVHGRCTTERKLYYREKNGNWVQVRFCLSCSDYRSR